MFVRFCRPKVRAQRKRGVRVRDAFWRTRDPIRISDTSQTRTRGLHPRMRRSSGCARAETLMCATHRQHCAFPIDCANRLSRRHNDVRASQCFRGCKRRSGSRSQGGYLVSGTPASALWAPARQPCSLRERRLWTACRAEAREINADWQEKGPPPPFGLRRGSLARFASEGWWAWTDLNSRPRPYQGRALAT